MAQPFFLIQCRIRKAFQYKRHRSALEAGLKFLMSQLKGIYFYEFQDIILLLIFYI